MLLRIKIPLSGYSDVTIEYGTYGRVYIRDYQYGYNRYEVCSDSFSSTDGEALCRSKGYSYSYFSTYVIRYHLLFVWNEVCVMKWLGIAYFFSILIPVPLQEAITTQWPPIAIYTIFTTVKSNNKTTVHEQYTSIVQVCTTALFQKTKTPFLT